MQILTFGHGTADSAQIVRLLRAADVARLVDVRTAPGSRRSPHVARAAIERWLPDAGIGYRWDQRLGGWRKSPADSPDTALRNRPFAGYAAHMRTADFLAGIGDLLDEAARVRLTVMCAESVWWRCHRRLIADHLVIVRDCDVRHIMHDGSIRKHQPTAEARLDPEPGGLVYDAGQEPLDL
jgi:uncharacterized protein (DUF488 family)